MDLRASALAPTARFLVLALVSPACLSMSAPAALCASASFVVLTFNEGVVLRRLAKETAFIVWMSAFAVLLQGIDFSDGITIDREGMGAALAYAARLLATFFAGRLFYAATTRGELRDVATRVARFLPGRAKSDLGLALSLVLGFLPLIAEEWKASLEAARARGLSRKPGLGASAILLSAFLRRLMLTAVSIPEALEARAWTGTRYVERRAWGWKDYCVVVLSGGLLVLAILRIV